MTAPNVTYHRLAIRKAPASVSTGVPDFIPGQVGQFAVLTNTPNNIAKNWFQLPDGADAMDAWTFWCHRLFNPDYEPDGGFMIFGAGHTADAQTMMVYGLTTQKWYAHSIADQNNPRRQNPQNAVAFDALYHGGIQGYINSGEGQTINGVFPDGSTYAGHTYGDHAWWPAAFGAGAKGGWYVSPYDIPKVSSGYGDVKGNPAPPLKYAGRVTQANVSGTLQWGEYGWGGRNPDLTSKTYFYLEGQGMPNPANAFIMNHPANGYDLTKTNMTGWRRPCPGNASWPGPSNLPEAHNFCQVDLVRRGWWISQGYATAVNDFYFQSVDTGLLTHYPLINGPARTVVQYYPDADMMVMYAAYAGAVNSDPANSFPAVFVWKPDGSLGSTPVRVSLVDGNGASLYITGIGLTGKVPYPNAYSQQFGFNWMPVKKSFMFYEAGYWSISHPQRPPLGPVFPYPATRFHFLKPPSRVGFAPGVLGNELTRPWVMTYVDFQPANGTDTVNSTFDTVNGTEWGFYEVPTWSRPGQSTIITCSDPTKPPQVWVTSAP